MFSTDRIRRLVESSFVFFFVDYLKVVLISKKVKENPKKLAQFIRDFTSLYLPWRISNCDEACKVIITLARDYCFSVNKIRLKELKKLLV